MQIARMGKGEVQTINYGKRPNVIRIYNKIAEWNHQYAKLTRESGGVSLPPFENFYGYPARGVLLTRVERQFGGNRIPEELRTFTALRNVQCFNPFQEPILPDRMPPSLPRVEDYGVEMFLAGMELRRRISEDGLHRVLQWLNRNGARHGKRILNKYRDFLPFETSISVSNLFEIFQTSVSRQVAA